MEANYNQAMDKVQWAARGSPGRSMWNREERVISIQNAWNARQKGNPRYNGVRGWSLRLWMGYETIVRDR